ncbi:ABC transporter permease [Paracoccaceae bacterium]|jgi:ribose transport system permease protein|nr:ABC transporter permease [Paracoccaceae bacterium]MDB3921014.1 ABC transporter permease [Paracoccaceae bacterium]MDC0582653.1 ABC transporter permease [Paracoccaceae bacterium]MED7678757.1 ABC transporter permease [Rhodobacteraceae bacterium IMCC15231]WRQ46640.1 ABC transporter permease [Rhodobacterales bacterium FZCC0083]|tara:strand:- start:756 stop:1766 length:1011 start_codon:yes stop_codon:yes gene_type:complete
MRSASRGMTAKFEGLVQNYSGLVVALVVLFLVIFFVGMATAPNFLTVFNLKTIVRDAALVGIMAIGLTFVTLSGNFFLLSLKETAALSIIAFATSMSAGYGFEISFLFTMVIAILTGSAQGVLIGLGGNPIVVTLGAAGLLYGLGAYWSDNLVVSFRRPHGAEWLGTGSFLGLPNITIAFILIAIVAELTLRFTNFGRQVYLIGANRAAGRATGHENFGMAIKTCVIASVCAAFVAIAFSAQVSSAQVNYFSSEFGSSGDMTIMVIATVMVGGNSIMGGYGSTIRSSLGAVFISSVDNMMVLHGFNSGPRVLAVGLMIVFSIMVFALVRRGSRSQE